MTEQPHGLSEELLEILACPKCKGGLQLVDAGTGLACERCCLVYEIRDSIPIMLVDEARACDPPPTTNG